MLSDTIGRGCRLLALALGMAAGRHDLHAQHIQPAGIHPARFASFALSGQVGATVPIPDVPEPPPARRSLLRWVAIGAVVGAAVGFTVAAVSYQASGARAGEVEAAPFLALSGIGFVGGGLIGAYAWVTVRDSSKSRAPR